jgi:hypothetical protein
MIKPTDEMHDAFWAAHDDPGDGGTERGLTAVLAIVERDYDVTPKPRGPGYCGAAGPDGLTCQRAPGHKPFLDETDHHAANTATGELVRW